MFKRVIRCVVQQRQYPRIPRTQFNKSGLSGNSVDGASSSSSSSFLGGLGMYRAMDSKIFTEPTIIIHRELEMMNVFLGYEQMNKYTVCDVLGNVIGKIEEVDTNSIMGFVKRQALRTRRPFDCYLWDAEQEQEGPLGTISRGLKLVNSHVQFNIDNTVLAESKQVWAPLRRKYDLYSLEENKKMNSSDPELSQFGRIDSQFLSWDFQVRNEQGLITSGIERSFSGFGREIFTDMGIYILRMDPKLSFNNVVAPEQLAYNNRLNFHQRCAMIASCVSIDFDYFSRHSQGLVSTNTYD